MSEIISTAWWDWRFTRWLHYLAALAAILIVSRLAYEEDVSWLAGVVMAVAVISLTAIRWPYGALAVLIGMSAMPVFYVELFGWKARPEHFATAIVMAAVAIGWLVFKQRLQFDRLDAWIAGFVAANFISSAFASSAPSSTLRWALQSTLAIAAYFLIRVLVSDLTKLKVCFALLLGVGFIESLYGIACWLSHQLFATTVGVQVGQYFGDVAAPYGSMYEPNLFGAYTGCCAVIFLASYLFAGRKLLYLLGYLVAAAAAIVSYSRASLLALVISSVWVIWKARGASRMDPKKLAFFAFAWLLAASLGFTSVGGVIRERFTNLLNEGLTEETTISRVVIIQEAVQELPGHLLLGNGTASFNLSFDWARFVPEWAGEQTWIGNAPLRILHDTGLLGIAALAGFFVLAWRKARISKSAPLIWVGLLVGLQAGILLYGISFESTDGTVEAFFWVHLGLFASAAILLSGVNQEVANTAPEIG